MAIFVNTDGNHHGLAHDMTVFAALEVGCIQPDEAEAAFELTAQNAFARSSSSLQSRETWFLDRSGHYSMRAHHNGAK